MTIDFCNEIYIRLQILIPGATADAVPEDFKLDNFMLRGAMRIFKLSRRLSRSI